MSDFHQLWDRLDGDDKQLLARYEEQANRAAEQWGNDRFRLATPSAPAAFSNGSAELTTDSWPPGVQPRPRLVEAVRPHSGFDTQVKACGAVVSMEQDSVDDAVDTTRRHVSAARLLDVTDHFMGIA